MGHILVLALCYFMCPCIHAELLYTKKKKKKNSFKCCLSFDLYAFFFYSACLQVHVFNNHISLSGKLEEIQYTG